MINISPTIAKVGKVLTGIAWIAVLCNFISPFFPAEFSSFLNTSALIIFAIHIVEALIFKDQINQQDNPGFSRLMVLLFGLFEVKSW